MAKAKKKESTLTLEEKLAQALVPESEQPYKVPKNWCWTYLDRVANWGSGGTPSRKRTEFYNGNIPWIKTGELKNDYIYDTEEKITEDAITNSSAKLFPKDTVIIAMYGATIGKVAILGVPAATNQACACAVCSQVMYNKFLFYYAISQKDIFINFGKGGAQPNISQEIIKNHNVPLPPFSEQQRIVERIESLFAKLDEAKEKLQEVLDGFETRKGAILHKAFTGELTAKWREENGVSLESWEKKKLGDITDIVSSKRIYKEEYVEKGIPFFRSSEVVELNDKGFTEPKYFVSENRYDEIKEKYGVPEKGDMLVTSVGTIGKTWIVDDRDFYYKDGNLTQIKQCTTLDMRFLQLFIKSEGFNEQIIDSVSGSAYNALTIVKFKKIFLNLPCIKEQKEIVRIVNAVLKREQNIRNIVGENLERVEFIKKAIVARAFRGELGTNDENDEGAVELLKRVL